MSWSTSSTDVPRDLVEWLAAGRVGRPHGLDGSFHVTHPRGALLPLGATVRIGDAEAEIVRRAGTDARPILRLAGHDDREAAEALRGQDLLVHRAAAPALGDDEPSSRRIGFASVPERRTIVRTPELTATRAPSTSSAGSGRTT